MHSNRLSAVLGCLMMVAVPSVLGQSSANFQIRDGKVSASDGTGVASSGFKTTGNVDATGISGTAVSQSFRIASGVPAYEVTVTPDPIFRSGFEN